MGKGKKVEAGDPCPQCGGTFVVDPAQEPEKLIDRVSRNAQNDPAAARFASQVREKAEEHGLIHVCTVCSYRSRFQPAAVDERAADDTRAAEQGVGGAIVDAAIADRAPGTQGARRGRATS